jgi:hypothetical protein
MSEASDSAHVRIIIADYAVADQQGKVTLVGAGVTVLGVNPAAGMTAPFAVVANASFDPKFVGDNPAFEVSLETNDGQLVQMPGQSHPLRVATSEKLPLTVLPGADVPNDAARPKAQIILQFQNGLPLAPGHGYKWRVKVDGETHEEWTEMMYIPTASAGPVLG